MFNLPTTQQKYKMFRCWLQSLHCKSTHHGHQLIVQSTRVVITSDLFRNVPEVHRHRGESDDYQCDASSLNKCHVCLCICHFFGSWLDCIHLFLHLFKPLRRGLEYVAGVGALEIRCRKHVFHWVTSEVGVRCVKTFAAAPYWKALTMSRLYRHWFEIRVGW